MSVTYDQAGLADEFHISHDGLPCTVWTRSGPTHYGPGPGQFYVGIAYCDPDDPWRPRETNGITRINAGDFHTAHDCPLARSGRPEVSPDQPVLDTGFRDCRDRDALGFDAAGYDTEGYDKDGFDAAGYDRDGKDAEGRPATTASELDLAGLWSEFRPSSRFDQEAFCEHLRKLVTDPDLIDDLKFCGNCEDPAWADDLTEAGIGDRICESCWDDWYDCDSCDKRFPDDDMTTTLGESNVCRGCRAGYYSFCEECDGYYPDGAADEHNHYDPDEDSDYGCCSSPQPAFSIRNDGCEPLANDRRVTITLPAGIISAEGLTAIRHYLQRQELYSVSYGVEKLGDAWQARDGNFAKRLSRMAYKDCQEKLTPEVLSQVGCIAREHSNQVSMDIEITRDLNMSSEAFANGGSCWWGGYSESRCALKTNGGFGLRSFNEYHDVCGRAWVLPLREDENGHLAPTFETMTPDAFVVFNGYGDLSGYAAPRIVAHMAGWTYRKISFGCSPMWVNPGGYLVAPEAIAEKYTDGRMDLTVSQHARLYAIEQENKEQAALREQAEREFVHA